MIPHVTNAIKERFRRIEEQTGADVVITEIGGTIGDIEGQPFVEAIRQFRKEKGMAENVLLHPREPGALHRRRPRGQDQAHPALRASELRSMGLQPDFIVCRSDHEIDAEHPRQDR